METARKIIEIASWITMIVCNIDSFTQEQIAITIIIMIISSYLAVLIHFYEESKKNHSYGRKSDSVDN